MGSGRRYIWDQEYRVMDNVKQLLTEILRTEFSNKLAFVGEVVSVDGTMAQIKNIETEGVYENVRLQAHPGSGVLIIPTNGSYVIVGRMSGGNGYIAMTSDADSIQLLDGSYGGLIKIDELVTKLNTLEQDLNALRDQFDTWVVVPNDGGAALKALLSPTWTVPQLTETEKEDLENTEITHGILP